MWRGLCGARLVGSLLVCLWGKSLHERVVLFNHPRRPRMRIEKTPQGIITVINTTNDNRWQKHPIINKVCYRSGNNYLESSTVLPCTVKLNEGVALVCKRQLKALKCSNLNDMHSCA
eukprot:scaffold1420_cov375-Pavlova_lutheri.AAC.10